MADQHSNPQNELDAQKDSEKSILATWSTTINTLALAINGTPEDKIKQNEVSICTTDSVVTGSGRIG